MDFVTAFISALLTILLVGALARIVASLLASIRSSQVAGFCIALGIALERYSVEGPPSRGTAIAVAAALGSMAALALLWFWLLKRETTARGSTGGLRLGSRGS
jgi:hypothetical protein